MAKKKLDPEKEKLLNIHKGSARDAHFASGKSPGEWIGRKQILDGNNKKKASKNACRGNNEHDD